MKEMSDSFNLNIYILLLTIFELILTISSTSYRRNEKFLNVNKILTKLLSDELKTPKYFDEMQNCIFFLSMKRLQKISALFNFCH